MVSIVENLVYLDGRLRQLSDAHKGQIQAAMDDQIARLVAMQTQVLASSDKNAQDTREVILQAIRHNEQMLFLSSNSSSSCCCVC